MAVAVTVAILCVMTIRQLSGHACCKSKSINRNIFVIGSVRVKFPMMVPTVSSGYFV